MTLGQAISAVYFSKSRKLDIRETASPPSVAEKVSSPAKFSRFTGITLILQIFCCAVQNI